MPNPSPQPTPHIPGRLPVWERLDELFSYTEYTHTPLKGLGLTTGTTFDILSLQAERYRIHCYKYLSEPGIFGVTIEQNGGLPPLLNAAFVTGSRVETVANVATPTPASYLLNLIDKAWIDPALTEEHAASVGTAMVGMVMRSLVIR